MIPITQRSGRPRGFMRTMPGRGGLSFRRRADGAVEVWRELEEHERLTSYSGNQQKRVAIIPANEWASIVAMMSATGEDAVTFNVALALHTAGVEHDPEAWRNDAWGFPVP